MALAPVPNEAKAVIHHVLDRTTKLSRKVAGRPVIFCRDQAGEIHCLFNTCRHRGAIVCTQPQGNARRFMCIYHGWTYGNDGQLLRVPGDDAYEAFDKAAYGLRRPARFEEYRGFWFMCFDKDAVSLHDYLADAKDYIDLVIDQSPSGRWRSSRACRNTTWPPTGS